MLHRAGDTGMLNFPWGMTESTYCLLSGDSPATIFGPTQPSTISVVNVAGLRAEKTWVFDPVFELAWDRIPSSAV